MACKFGASWASEKAPFFFIIYGAYGLAFYYGTTLLLQGRITSGEIVNVFFPRPLKRADLRPILSLQEQRVSVGLDCDGQHPCWGDGAYGLAFYYGTTLLLQGRITSGEIVNVFFSILILKRADLRPILSLQEQRVSVGLDCDGQHPCWGDLRVFFFIIYGAYGLAFYYGTTLLLQGRITSGEIVSRSPVHGQSSRKSRSPHRARTRWPASSARAGRAVKGLIELENIDFIYPSR
jgi:hypothetical protein